MKLQLLITKEKLIILPLFGTANECLFPLIKLQVVNIESIWEKTQNKINTIIKIIYYFKADNGGSTPLTRSTCQYDGIGRRTGLKTP